MAKNYTLTEAIIIAHENGDLEALADLGRRYPLLMAKVMRLVSKAGEEAIDLAQYFPEYLSANKVNKAIKDGNVTTGSADEDAEDEDDDTEDETPKSKKATAGGKPAKGKKAADDDEDEDGEESKYASMSSRDLWNLLGKLNARKACEKEFGDLKKGSMVKYLEKYGEGTPDADEPEEDEEEESTDEYTGKSAVELFKLCKQRKVKAEPKKPAKYYIDLLKKDDAAKAAETEDDDEEWDDDEEEETPAPKAKGGKGKTEKAAKAEKPAKGGKKKVAEEDDEDDEWEI